MVARVLAGDVQKGMIIVKRRTVSFSPEQEYSKQSKTEDQSHDSSVVVQVKGDRKRAKALERMRHLHRKDETCEMTDRAECRGTMVELASSRRRSRREYIDE